MKVPHSTGSINPKQRKSTNIYFKVETRCLGPYNMQYWGKEADPWLESVDEPSLSDHRYITGLVRTAEGIEKP